MRFPRNRQIFRGQLDVAAFASVLFLMLMFILLRSQLVFTPGIPIRLVESKDAPGIVGRTVVVAVDSSGQYYFDNQLIHERPLKQRLIERVQASREPLTLVIQADESVNARAFTRLGNIAFEAGIRAASLASRPGPPARRNGSPP